MRLIDADALKDYIDAQEGRPFIGCTVGEALKIMTDEQPTIADIIQCKDCKLYIQPEQGKVYGRCTYSRDSTPRTQTDFCSYAKQSD